MVTCHNGVRHHQVARWYKAALVGTVQTQPVRDTEAICVGGSWVWLARLFYGVLSAITCCYLAVVHLATERLPS